MRKTSLCRQGKNTFPGAGQKSDILRVISEEWRSILTSCFIEEQISFGFFCARVLILKPVILRNFSFSSRSNEKILYRLKKLMIVLFLGIPERNCHTRVLLNKTLTYFAKKYKSAEDECSHHSSLFRGNILHRIDGPR